MPLETIYGAYVLALVFCGLAFGDAIVDVLVSAMDTGDVDDADDSQ